MFFELNLIGVKLVQEEALSNCCGRMILPCKVLYFTGQLYIYQKCAYYMDFYVLKIFIKLQVVEQEPVYFASYLYICQRYKYYQD
jgi:hypothetical protein